MKVLIVYATRTGTTERAARMLAGHFPGAHLCDLREENPDPSGYDIILFGSGIYFGRILKPLKIWLNEYWEVIRPKIKGVFICNAINELDRLRRCTVIRKQKLPVIICLRNNTSYTAIKYLLRLIESPNYNRN